MPTRRDTHPGQTHARAPRGSVARVVRTVVLVLLALLIVAMGLFTWNRWFRFDDAADLQGVWRSTEGSATLALDGSRMLVDGQVAYDYEVDAASKTIAYTFGGAQGTSSYRFGDGRSTLVLEDNGATDWLMAFHLKEDEVLAGGQVPEGCTRLKRTDEDVAKAFQAYDKKPADADGQAADEEGARSDELQSQDTSATMPTYQDVTNDQQNASGEWQGDDWSQGYAQDDYYAQGAADGTWQYSAYDDGSYATYDDGAYAGYDGTYGTGAGTSGQGW